MTTWGLQTFTRANDPIVATQLRADGWRVIRVQAGPEEQARRGAKNAKVAAKWVADDIKALTTLGFEVWLSPYTGPGDMSCPISMDAYLDRLAAALPSMTFVVDAELDQPKIAPPGGVADVVAMIRRLREHLSVRVAGPGQTRPHLDFAARVLDAVEVDIPTFHGYPDRGPAAFGEWLDECEATARRYGYESGALTEVGAHGNRSRPMGTLLWTWTDWLSGLSGWNPLREQASRLSGVRAEVEQRLYWTHAFVYQVADAPPDDPDEGYPEGFGLYGPDALTPKPSLSVFRRSQGA